MTRRLTLAGIMLGALAMPAAAQRHGGGDNGRDPGPEAITRRSIHRIQRVTHRGVRIMHGQARRGAMAITHLLQNEEPDRAAQVAERGIGRINHVAERVSETIANIVERAAAALGELEAPAEMAEAVQNAAQRGLDAIRENRAAAIQIVEDALAGSPPE